MYFYKKAKISDFILLSIEAFGLIRHGHTIKIRANMNKNIIATAVIALVWSVGATATQQKPLFERWLTHTSTFFNSQTLEDNQSQVIFYRDANAITGPAVNIYVDGDYHASLLPNHYKAIALCAQAHFFSTAFSSNTTFANKDEGIYFIVPAKRSSFIKVVRGNNGEPEFERVDAETGERVIQKMSEQKQTLSRVIPATECREKTVLQNFSLSARTLFRSGRADQAGMFPAGKEEILDLAADLKRLDQRHISHIVISGHSAPDESPAISRQLSANRAKTVLNLLQREGVQFPMEVTGYGSQQLVSKNCAERNPTDTKMREACDQSNRRVEVTVYAIQ
ncbi:OmpA/MotB family protein [Testudinibacter sp. P80/BLE/0925]|uniref:OmpA/MotB family protein n=1 Tax=Testudinibacter sp. TW-1 TaxID=3417757 RepID=UPI003D35ED83